MANRRRSTGWTVLPKLNGIGSLGDSVSLEFPVTTEIIASQSSVADDTGRIAVQRGPIIFCMEQLDQPGGIDLSDVSFALTPKLGQEFQADYKSDLLDWGDGTCHDGDDL